MKTIQDLLYWGKTYLETCDVEDATLSTKILLSHATGIPSIEFIKDPEVQISDEVTQQFKDLVFERGEGAPIAYLTGKKEFYSLSFFVNKHVLIPRPETEILIEWFGKKIGNQSLKVCDVGTGSGAIAVSLKKTFPELNVTAVDISIDALEVAKKNAEHNEVQISFLQSDLLEKVGNLDVIVANLPYIRTEDMDLLPAAVQYEPKLALDSGANGLDHYGRLIPQAQAKLSPGGSLFLEYGVGQTESLKSLLETTGFSNIEVRKDYAGIDRIIFAQRL